MHANSRFRQAITERRQQQLYRQPTLIEQYQGRLVQVAGQQYLNFSGNDYLGLAQADQLKAALSEGALRFGSGSSGSPVLTGFHYAHQALTDKLCDWLQVEDVLLMSSGFAANQLLLHTLPDKQDHLLLDKLCHASLIDAALTAPCSYSRFSHQDWSALDSKLRQRSNSWVVTEGVFSMDGDSPDWSQLTALCASHQAELILDDAHGLGQSGPEGRGSWAAQGGNVAGISALMANFGKALAGQGAFVAGSKLLIDYLRQFGRHYIYSTSLSPALCWALCTAIDLCRKEQWRRDKLQQHSELFRRLAAEAELPLLPSVTAIQPVLVGDTEKALMLSEQLKQRGIWLSAIRPPTVPRHGARLRVTLSALHQTEDIYHLIKTLRSLW
ncbi:8-amino-7-oxononanoate synthase [Rheinheimera sp.]|uniref:aminotransferase class I/II-fold pyridoxal phosphate-dependent enzyme n=1 Tax=Rheinheimera sp. TaxID=1869214 RepID=UPI00307D8126